MIHLYLRVSLGLFIAGAVPSIAFCVLYTIKARWWKSREGVHLFGFTATVALLLGLSALVRWVGPDTWVIVTALVLYVAVDVFMWQRLYLLMTAQRIRFCLWWRGRR